MEIERQAIEIPATSGSMPCFVARPVGVPRAPAVIVVQEAFGLNGHIEGVAARLAADGYVTLAPDLYWRGGKRRAVGYDQLGDAIALMQSIRDDQIVADIASAVAWLERQAFVRSDRIGITGFCMGGRVSYLAACELPDKIKAAVPFYGGGNEAATTEKPSMYPCSARIRASSRLSRDEGMATVSFCAPAALRRRVRKSATGSVMDMPRLLPARLGHAGHEALVGELAQADPADAELAEHRTRAAAAAAARVVARLVLLRAAGPHPLRCLCH